MEDVTYSHKEMARLILRIWLRRLEIVNIGRQPQGLLEEGRPPTTNHLGGGAHELHPPPWIALRTDIMYTRKVD